MSTFIPDGLPDPPEPARPPDPMRPYRALAAAVLVQALNDARGLGRTPDMRRDESERAAAWLHHGEDLPFWAELLGVDAHRFRRAASRLLNAP